MGRKVTVKAAAPKKAKAKPRGVGISLSAFITKYKGRSAWWLGNDQCVALVELWAHNLGKHPIPGANAKDLFARASTTEWRKVRNAASNFPPAGAIIVWGSGVGHGHGHTAVARPGCTAHTILSFDQNWSYYHRCSLETHKFDYVIGWLIHR